MTNSKLRAKVQEIFGRDWITHELNKPMSQVENDLLTLIEEQERKARVDELKAFREDEGSSGTAYYLTRNGNNIEDRIKELRSKA